ncbi:MAG: dihydroorotate dehydrogenase electron transfer subunit [bacterium]
MTVRGGAIHGGRRDARAMRRKYALTATVVSRTEVAADLFEIVLDCPAIARSALPGQFLQVRGWNGCQPLLRRPISIAGTTAGCVVLLIKIVGTGTRLICSREEGETLELIGPLGNGFPPPENSARRLLVSGGFGVAPLLFFAAAYDVAGGKILYGARTGAELHTGIHGRLGAGWSVVHATEDGSTGRRGTVIALMEEELARDDGWDRVLACGPGAMLKQAARCARSHGVRCMVSLEVFMGCGVGACTACAVPVIDGDRKTYTRACHDGPVFDAEKIVWEELPF